MALNSKFMQLYGYDLLLGSIAAFYVFMAPYTKVEESFNVQYDHLEFPGVVPRTFIGTHSYLLKKLHDFATPGISFTVCNVDFIGALFVSILASPFVLAASLLHLPKLYSLYAVRLVLGCMILSTLRFFRIQIRKNFGSQVEVFFVILTVLQFHVLFYCTRPLPNILAFGLVNLAYGYWFKGSFYAALNYLIFATIVFRCDILLLVSPLGLELLLSRSISLRKAILSCLVTALFCIGLTILVDSVLWRKLLWPELEVFWFNSVLNRSSEWGTHSFHWYFTSALPRSLLAAYPLFLVSVRFYCPGNYLVSSEAFLVFCLTEGSGSMLFLFYHLFCFIQNFHKELRFIISSLPIFNLSAAIAASRIFNNRKKSFWKYLYVAMLGFFLISLGCTVLTFMASYENYPSGHALKALHKMGRSTNNSKEVWVHIDTFSAMNGISRFCENNEPWRYSKEEGIPVQEFQGRNFTYLLSEHAPIHGYKCLFSTKGFSGARLHVGFPPISLVSGEASTILPDVPWNQLELESSGISESLDCYATVIWNAVFTVLVWITNTPVS
ncbi:Dol-P-Man:Man(7)GlcNAc(2)-PP-Dol alpha-1,6-mannosyltransferase [Sesamum angolense]|uniref:Mannosyltransferase n=1 Tax=Sesamum angolense TaxID=2727404 RepID=A0AAE2C748_9LAMI|nr:Dol-P-Man:Man(7)GlcNAc(2)-PP-Dol alpha-1,6-mannosyltransferase [Sesamum angolense]